MTKQLFIKFGAILPFIAAPQGVFRVIGVVQEGMQFGYLTVSPSGEYLQVNGSVTRTLNAAKVRAALRKAWDLQHGRRPQAGLGCDEPQPSSQIPVVIVRKRRRVPIPLSVGTTVAYG